MLRLIDVAITKMTNPNLNHKLEKVCEGTLRLIHAIN